MTISRLLTIPTPPISTQVNRRSSLVESSTVTQCFMVWPRHSYFWWQWLHTACSDSVSDRYWRSTRTCMQALNRDTLNLWWLSTWYSVTGRRQVRSSDTIRPTCSVLLGSHCYLGGRHFRFTGGRLYAMEWFTWNGFRHSSGCWKLICLGLYVTGTQLWQYVNSFII